ncbi:MAG: F0F1 ATP synthase subunit delta [Microbacteriaceae bacterium]|jgi:F-type H+-transporting ATPase subunit delta|nr:F0F1 ATP synthase subunit delta [Microbacteriaceae bacterium]MCI1207679.1 F0F1 ATP synthase subunit delta [Microbacteriaceae bacterium]
MGSATTQSLQTLREKLRETPDLARRDAALQLLEGAATIGSVRKLRVTLSDPALQPERRAQLIHALFDGKAEPGVTDFLADTVRLTWSASRDLPEALQELGMRAFALAAGASGNRDRLQDELFAVAEVFASSAELQLGLVRPDTDRGRAAKFAHDLLGGQVLPETEELVAFAVGSTRGARVSRLLRRFGEIVAESAGRTVARVTSARPLDATQRKQLMTRLEQRAGGPVAIDGRVDPALVGGARVQIGAELIDASISARLEGLRHALAHA